MGVQGYAQGGEGNIGIKISWRPGDVTDPNAYEAPDQFLLAESKNLDETFMHVEHDAYVNSRDTDKGHRHGKATSGGPFTFALYPTNGEDIWEAALGFATTVSAITPDTASAIQNGTIAAPGAPTTTPSGSGGTIAAGTYEYAVTFTTQYGETSLGTATGGDVLSGATSSEALTAIPVGPAGTTGRNIYRKKDAAAFAFVHTLANNTATTWTDTGAVAGAAAPTENTSLGSQMSVVTLTTGNVAYTTPSKGKPVLIDSGFNQELRAVLDYDATNKFLFVGLLGERDGREITHTAPFAVVAPSVDLKRTINRSDFAKDYSNLLPRVCAEDSIGGKFSYRYRGGHVGKVDLKASATKVTVSSEVFFNKPRQLANGVAPNPDPTTFDDTETSLNDLSYEYQDGFLAMDADPDSTQTPILQRMDDAVTWEINFNNNLKKEATMDGTAVERFLPGAKRKIDVKIEALNPTDYPVIYEKYVSKDQDMQFFAQFAINEGTDASPNFKTKIFYLPHVRYIKSTTKDGLTDTVSEVAEGVARRANGMEKIYVYSIA